jgi:hypothetical protein
MPLWPSGYEWLEPPSQGVNLDLWPAHSWDEEELSELTAALQPCGTTTSQRSSGPRGIELQIIISFAAGAVAAGFFNALGTDLYSKLRDKLVKRLYREKKDLSALTDKTRREDGEAFGFLTLIFPHGDGQMRLECLYRTEEELERFLREAPTYAAALLADIAAARGPFASSVDVSVNLEARTSNGVWAWKIDACEHDPYPGKWVGTLSHAGESSSPVVIEWHVHG